MSSNILLGPLPAIQTKKMTGIDWQPRKTIVARSRLALMQTSDCTILQEGYRGKGKVFSPLSCVVGAAFCARTCTSISTSFALSRPQLIVFEPDFRSLVAFAARRRDAVPKLEHELDALQGGMNLVEAISGVLLALQTAGVVQWG